MKTKQDTGGTGAGTDHQRNPNGNIFTQIMKLPGAVEHLLAGPPMTDQSRFNHELAEARARNEWLGLR